LPERTAQRAATSAAVCARRAVHTLCRSRALDTLEDDSTLERASRVSTEPGAMNGAPTQPSPKTETGSPVVGRHEWRPYADIPEDGNRERIALWTLRTPLEPGSRRFRTLLRVLDAASIARRTLPHAHKAVIAPSGTLGNAKETVLLAFCTHLRTWKTVLLAFCTHVRTHCFGSLLRRSRDWASRARLLPCASLGRRFAVSMRPSHARRSGDKVDGVHEAVAQSGRTVSLVAMVAAGIASKICGALARERQA
jgi:hypothetical protein